MLASFVIPFRNAGATLAQCILSLQSQSCPDFEALLVDDGSQDDGPGIIKEAAKLDPRLRLLASSGRGIVSALNTGLLAASGRFLVRMDADDICHSTRLERQLEHLNKVDVSSTTVELFGGTGPGMIEYFRWQNDLLTNDRIRANRFVECPVHHPTLALKTELLSDIGGYRSGDFPEDYDLFLRLQAAGASFGKLGLHGNYRGEGALFQYRCSDQQLSRTDARYNRSAFHYLRKQYLQGDDFVMQKIQGAFVVWGASRRSRRRFEDHFPDARPRYLVDIKPSLIGRLSSKQTPGIFGPEYLYADPDRPFVFVYVNARGARPVIEQSLIANGYVAGRDYLCIG